MRDLPSGTVTFLFTDVEGSTRLLHELGAERYAEALADHRRVLRAAFGAHGGVEVDTQGDAFFVAFPTAPGALAAARAALADLAPGRIRVRMGIHTGTPYGTDEGYVGTDVHRAARIAGAGHGGQVLVSAATASLVGTDGLRDLGEHRLKDLSAPERIYQLGEDDFPPLQSLHRTNLPVPATPFVGRERELAEVCALVAGDDVRLLTLTGPGGTGKTRLALQAAAGAAEAFPGGVFWVPLAPLRDPALVLESAAAALGAKKELGEHIGDKRLLLFLDNFEHLIEAADDLPTLLAACPNLHLLVTSRELLRLPGEQAYPVSPLDAGDGRELFLARARAADPRFEPTAAVSELCARLEQLPLALELAAARVRLLSPQQLLERLSRRLDLLKAGRGVDPRQQTLRATIEWSHGLLDPQEQRLFGRLAVFAGGCTLEAAEDVCDADLDVLQSLVDKSLVRVREGSRFWMLETIREYAAERLDASGEADDLRRRHAEHFLALAAEAESHLGTHSKQWLDRVGEEHDNVRAALDRLEATGDTQSVLRLAAAVSDFWGIRGHIVEARQRLAAALRADQRPTSARAKALNAAADLAPDAASERRWAQEALRLHRATGDQSGVGLALIGLGNAAAVEEDWEAARRHWEESACVFEAEGDEHHALLASRLLAWSYESLGQRERAIDLHEDNMRRARAAGNQHMQAQALEGLAALTIAQGRAEEAVPMLEEAYHLHRQIDDPWRIAVLVGRFGRVLAALGRAALATRLLASAQALAEEAGGRVPWVEKMSEETLAMIRPRLDDTAFAHEWERGRALTAEEAIALAVREVGRPAQDA